MGDKINIQELIDALAERSGISKPDAEIFVKATFDLIEETLEADKYVKIKGLGTFKLTEVSNRESVNVNTGERIIIKGHSKISFIPDLAIRDLINKPFAHFETVILNDDTVLEDTPMENEDVEEDAEIETINEKTAIVPDIQEEIEAETNAAKEVEEAIEPAESPIPESVVPEKETSDENIAEKVGVETSEEKESPIEEQSLSTAENGKKRKWPYVAGVLLVTVLLLTGLFYFVFKPDCLEGIITGPVGCANQDIPDVQLNPKDSVFIPTATTEKVEEDTLKPIEPVQTKIDTTKTIISGIRKGMDNVKPDSTSYVIVGTMAIYKIGMGETLTMVSKRFYETKDLWPYLVKYNQTIIKNPNRVPSGTVIRIPALRDKEQQSGN